MGQRSGEPDESCGATIRTRVAKPRCLIELWKFRVRLKKARFAAERRENKVSPPAFGIIAVGGDRPGARNGANIQVQCSLVTGQSSIYCLPFASQFRLFLPLVFRYSLIYHFLSAAALTRPRPPPQEVADKRNPKRTN